MATDSNDRRPRLNSFGEAIRDIEAKWADENAALWAAETDASLRKMVARGGQVADGARDEIARRKLGGES